MQPPALFLLPELFKQIQTEGQTGYPNEICGMIFGEDDMTDGVAKRIARKLVPGTNAFEADEQYHRFSIDPLQQLKAERAAEAEDLILIGYYHSHPDHPAKPSQYDLDHAWEVYSYVIVSIEKGQAVDMTSWVLHTEGERQFLRQEIVEA